MDHAAIGQGHVQLHHGAKAMSQRPKAGLHNSAFSLAADLDVHGEMPEARGSKQAAACLDQGSADQYVAMLQ
jgi:hypothetical protein